VRKRQLEKKGPFRTDRAVRCLRLQSGDLGDTQGLSVMKKLGDWGTVKSQLQTFCEARKHQEVRVPVDSVEPHLEGEQFGSYYDTTKNSAGHYKKKKWFPENEGTRPV